MPAGTAVTVRPPDPNRAPWVTRWALGLFVPVIVFYLVPHAGHVAVNVADAKGSRVSHLSIYIDGKRRCDSAPCLVSDVAAGSHTVRVEASGFEPPADRAVAVESRKDTTVDFRLAPTANGGTGICVAGTQSGTTLFVDDKEMGALPQCLHDMEPGSHRVKIAGSERYAPEERTVTVVRDELQDLGAVTLKVVKGKATFSRETPGATVFLVSGGDRWEIPALPISVDIDTSKPWSLVASKPGYGDYVQPISFDDGQAEKVFAVALNAKTGNVALGPPSPVAETGEAFLKINSIPASSVTLDGKPIGSTPKVKYRVSSGTHSLVFINLDQGFKKQISVTVAAGETKAAICRN
jgi:hypothetical protein